MSVIGESTMTMRRHAGCALVRAFIAACLIAASSSVAALAQDTTDSAGEPPPAKVQQLLELLDDPAVHNWLAQHRTAATPAPSPSAASKAEMTASGYAATRIAAIRAHVASLIAGLPRVPGELERAGIILSLEFQERGLWRVLLLIGGFAALGLGVEWLFWQITRGPQKWIVTVPLDTVGQRLRAVAIRLAFGLGLIASFAVGSVGAFLTLDWPPLLREIVLGYLMAFLVLRLTLVAARFLLAPGGVRFRILLMSMAAASFWIC